MIRKKEVESQGWMYAHGYNIFYKPIDEERGWTLQIHKDRVEISNNGECWFWGVLENEEDLITVQRLLQI